MKIMQEEIFGPVVAAIPFDDAEESIRAANDSQYGLRRRHLDERHQQGAPR